MLDKEKISKVIEKIVAYYSSCPLHEMNIDLVYEFKAFFSSIQSGDFDIKPEAKETCEWNIINQSGGENPKRVFSTQCNNKFSVSVSEQTRNDLFQNKENFQYCPFCSKFINFIPEPKTNQYLFEETKYDEFVNSLKKRQNLILQENFFLGEF